MMSLERLRGLHLLITTKLLYRINVARVAPRRLGGQNLGVNTQATNTVRRWVLRRRMGLVLQLAFKTLDTGPPKATIKANVMSRNIGPGVGSRIKSLAEDIIMDMCHAMKFLNPIASSPLLSIDMPKIIEESRDRRD
jgi:hypothetical protein